MAETLAALLTAHLLGDFPFQTDWMVKHKRDVGVLLLHVLVVTVVSWLLLGAFHWQVLLAIFLTHTAMDLIKTHKMKDTLVSFLIDQFVHIAVLVGLVYFYPNAASTGWWVTELQPEVSKWYFATLCCLAGLVLAVPAGGILISKATSPFMEQIEDTNIEGLQQGGKYIGWLERFLVLLLVLINQPTGIGFLMAAKSVLRFGEIKEASQRKVAEYIIIGTFLSFGWALLVSVLAQGAIYHWLSPAASTQ
jgi:hypothetical protein